MRVDIRPATVIREVDPAEDWATVVDEAKSWTWQHRCEVALIQLATGQLLMVQGGADGLAFDADAGQVFVVADGVRHRVDRLAWHTHPRCTGPSDHDRRFLRVLGQASSMIYEMFADGRGTRFRADDPEVKP